MNRIALLIVFLLLLVVHSQSQEIVYRLHEPSISEYLEIVPSALETYSVESAAELAKNPYHPMIDIITTEFIFRYSEDALLSLPYNTLASTYDALNRYAPCCHGLPFASSNKWLSPMVEAWVRENIEIIAKTDDYRDDTLSLNITPMNLDDDVESEYRIYVETDSSDYTIYFVDIESQNPATYSLQILPFGWDSYAMPSAYDIETRLIDDINLDGVVDWIIFASSYSYFQSCGQLYILNWSDGQLVDLLLSDSFLCEPEPIEFLNLDDDADLEIQQSEYHLNNWFCVWYLIKTFDWNGIEYHSLGETQVFDETLGCAMHKAEPSMWENQWEEAIPIYEQGLDLGWINYSDTSDANRLAEMTQYAKLRLVLAYWLVGRNAEAEDLFSELQSEEPLSQMMASLIVALDDADNSILARCIAVYNVFWEYEQAMFYYDLPSNIEVGYMDFAIGAAPPAPERAGCDAPTLIDNILNELDFQSDTSPIRVLENASIEVENHLEADLNLDGISDWLMWLTAKVPPVLLLSDNNGEYQLSRPTVRRPDDIVEISVIETPDESGLWIADYAYLPDTTSNEELVYYLSATPECEGKETYYGLAIGELRLWRVQDSTLETAVEMPLCANRPLAEIIQESKVLRGWATIAKTDTYYGTRLTGEVLYTWDEETRNYIPPEPEIIVDATSESPEQSIFEASYSALQHFSDGEYETALSLLDETIARLDVETSDWIVDGLQYYRALNLEALGRTDEAVMTYQALAEAESAWSMLAELHIEPINP